ncbi:MAG: hypothetical protein GY757_04125, partial [bacterium]|nr:hypothetical protein [bacterium]
MNAFLDGSTGKQLVDGALNNKELDKLAMIWTTGMEINWKRLYRSPFPSKTILPGYPFSQTSYWMQAGKEVKTAIHPLLHQNTSDLSEQRYSSTFTGREFFLNDHRVNGQKVFPGVCYLEMAGTAIEKAVGQQEEGTSLHLKNIVWSRPITVDESPQDVHIALFEKTDGQIQYQVYTSPESESEIEEAAIVHSPGVAHSTVNDEVLSLDIAALKSQMPQGVL